MRILKLLEGLYQELKTFNENVDYYTHLKNVKKDKPEYSLAMMTDTEVIALKIWIKKRLEEKNITFQGKNYHEEKTRNFLELDYRLTTKPVRTHISAALGYSSFDELLAAYKKERV